MRDPAKRHARYIGLFLSLGISQADALTLTVIMMLTRETRARVWKGSR